MPPPPPPHFRVPWAVRKGRRGRRLPPLPSRRVRATSMRWRGRSGGDIDGPLVRRRRGCPRRGRGCGRWRRMGRVRCVVSPRKKRRRGRHCPSPPVDACGGWREEEAQAEGPSAPARLVAILRSAASRPRAPQQHRKRLKRAAAVAVGHASPKTWRREAAANAPGDRRAPSGGRTVLAFVAA